MGALDDKQLLVVEGSCVTCFKGSCQFILMCRAHTHKLKEVSETITIIQSQEGGPTQSQLSRPMSSRHHISMEHRLRRKHVLLNPSTHARSGIYVQRKKTETHFSRKTKNWENEKNTKKKEKKEKRLQRELPPEDDSKKCFVSKKKVVRNREAIEAQKNQILSTREKKKKKKKKHEKNEQNEETRRKKKK